MTDFNHWDIVVSKFNGKCIEAEVDFQQWDNLYISEWWKSLKCPVRYVIDKDAVAKKEKDKIKISLLEMNYLMDKILWLKDQDYNSEPDLKNLKEWQTFTNWNVIYKYVWEIDWEPVWEQEWFFCTIRQEDLGKLLWTKDYVCSIIFWVPKENVEII